MTQFSPHKPIDIRNLDQLLSFVKPPFILLIGSAVPGMNCPHLPMVQELMIEVLKTIAQILGKGNYPDRLFASYALSLCNGKYSNIIKTTKFEEFLWKVQLAVNRDKLDDLLFRSYHCHSSEYGINQRAIAWMLNNRYCSACLTTNFDNSIELAFPTLKKYIHPRYPKTLGNSTRTTILLKLHGDALLKTCLATSPNLTDAKRLRAHRKLPGLLKNKTILTFGYSGIGDVDISPHLKLTKANFFWFVKGKNSFVPEYANYRICSDLKNNDLQKNLLLGLAHHFGWQVQANGNNHDWKTGIHLWCNSLSKTELRKIILQTFFGQAGFPTLHMSKFINLQLSNDQFLIDKGISCMQISAYKPAIDCFKKAISLGNLTPMQLFTALDYLGLAQWRAGENNNAMSTLSYFLKSSFNKCSYEERCVIGGGIRVYLETAQDQIRLIPSLPKRKLFYYQNKIGQVIKRFRQFPIPDLQGEILAQTTILNLNYLIGKKVSIKKVINLFEESYNAMLWGIAEGVVRLLVSLSFLRGLKYMARITIKLIQRKQGNVLRKTLTAFLSALPFIKRYPFIFDILNGPTFLKKIYTYRNMRYEKKNQIWAEFAKRGIIKLE